MGLLSMFSKKTKELKKATTSIKTGIKDMNAAKKDVKDLTGATQKEEEAKKAAAEAAKEEANKAETTEEATEATTEEKAAE